MRFSISHFENTVSYIKLENPIQFNGFEAVGYFPYTRASIDSSKTVRVHRNLYSEIETKLRLNGVSDNKYVVIFRSLDRFGDEDFAIYLKDAWAVVGSLGSVRDYNGEELEVKK